MSCFQKFSLHAKIKFLLTHLTQKNVMMEREREREARYKDCDEGQLFISWPKSNLQ